MLAAVIGVFAYGQWLVAVEPEDIVMADDVQSAPKGNWIVAGGESSFRFGLRAAFLINLESGEYLRIFPRDLGWIDGLVFSADGSRAAWLESSDRKTRQLMYAVLEENKPVSVASHMFFSGRLWIELSNNGDRIAVLEDRTLSVSELESGRLVAAAQLPEGGEMYHLGFVHDNLVRVRQQLEQPLNPQSPSTTEIFEFDLGEQKLEHTGSLGRLGSWALVRPDANSRRLLIADYRGEKVQWSVRDASSGAVLFDLGSVPGYRRSGMFLRDGGIVRVREDDEDLILDVFDGEGGPGREIRLGEYSMFVMSGEYSVRRLVVGEYSSARKTGNGGMWKSVAVDLETGMLHEIPGEGYPPVHFYGWRMVQPASPVASRLIMQGSDRNKTRGRIVLWDPESDTLKEVIGR